MTINQHHVVLIRRIFSIKYNVPYGRYLHPTIYNEEIILNSHNALQIVEINVKSKFFCNNFRKVDILHISAT